MAEPVSLKHLMTSANGGKALVAVYYLGENTDENHARAKTMAEAVGDVVASYQSALTGEETARSRITIQGISVTENPDGDEEEKEEGRAAREATTPLGQYVIVMGDPLPVPVQDRIDALAADAGADDTKTLPTDVVMRMLTDLVFIEVYDRAMAARKRAVAEGHTPYSGVQAVLTTVFGG